MGGFLAADAGSFHLNIFLLCVITTICLQILSNLANDYGDSIHGADSVSRKGPSRAVQSGVIRADEMWRAILLFGTLSLVSGMLLLFVSFGFQWDAILFFLALGLLSIGAAVTYTVGRKPYGYLGLGDLSVFVFFGLVGVLGSYYLFTKDISWLEILPATSMGLLSVAVLNVNNIRDIESDKLAGKFSIPVRLGRRRAVVYHWLLLAAAVVCAVVYSSVMYRALWQFLFMLAIPLFVINGRAIASRPSDTLDPYLKQMAISALLFALLFGGGLLLS
jgi:1,4-dihydroxy-2-naphthoate octaprenyltransferase